ncbi:MAG TPA: tetratricopeptide repeat protein [Gammaproteobacteria bacterium]|nr:tetratricopeptide repeat protein [Gammaproteobacteria bacterium]
MRGWLALIACVVLTTGCVSVPVGNKWSVDARVDIQTRLGLSYMKLGRLEPAALALGRALALAPNDSRANHAMALFQLRISDRAAAEPYFRQAVDTDNDNFSARNDFGGYLCQSGRMEEGLVQFDRALRNPYNDRLYISQLGAGACYVRILNWKEAEGYFFLALVGRPKLAMALYQMAEVTFAQADHLRTRAYLQRFFDTGAESAASLLLAVRNELKLQASDLVQLHADRLRTEFPTSSEASDMARLMAKAND